ncbi:MAG: methyltransferase domain-containing protein [Nitrospinae bacterium]|nr:methyltransferase domain-containing protein [Nitrospinota bacterium]
MQLDLFERYKHNHFLVPISVNTLKKIGEHIGVSTDFLVFDASCGKGGSVISLAKMFGCSAIGLDDRPEFVEDGRRRTLFEDLSHLIDLLVHTNDDFPFDDDYFDLVLLCEPAYPSSTASKLNRLTRIVKPGGWIAYSGLVWKSDDENIASERLMKWLDSYLPCEPIDVEELWAHLIEQGYEVEFVEHETDHTWENFLAPQARSIIENRLEYAESLEAQDMLDRWQLDLEIYHKCGGKQLLGYATFLLRCPWGKNKH